MDILKNIRETALTHPKRCAVQSREQKLTYEELEEYSNRLAVWIAKNSQDRKRPVIVYGHKNPYMVVCFLACAKAGRSYVPQDICIPVSRVDETVLSVEPELTFVVEGDYQTEIGTEIGKDEIEEIVKQETNETDVLQPLTRDEVWYIIFTSGSTGKPKGVEITRDCLSHYLDWSVQLGSTMEEKGGAHFMNQAPFSFDLSVMDLYTSLVCGGTLYTMDKKMQSDYSEMLGFLEQSEIEIWVSTPSFADMCLADRNFCGEKIETLKLFLFCGEVLTTATVEKLKERFPEAVIINTYGPTESTVAVTDVTITEKLLQETIARGKSLPVGHEKPGTYIEIWDKAGKVLPEGEQGEIVIIGDTVSCGYYMRADLTKKAFFHCIRDGKAYRGYKTGDAGYLKGGQLYYNGRIDLQVKLHGYRIEIEDIENNMVRLPQIDHAVVVPNLEEGKVKSLTAFVTGAQVAGKKASEISKQVKNGLKEFLPVYMIPKKIKYIETMPMNNHGKADRKYLGGLAE